MAKDKKTITIRIAIIVCVILTLLSGCVTEGAEENKGLMPGEPLPQFSVKMNDGREITPSTLKGKNVLIEFFNTSCQDCRESLPTINRLYQSLKDNDNVEILAIAREEGATEIAGYWQENDFTLPYSPQPDRKVYELFATVGIPRIFIAGADGIITATFGPDDRPTLTQLTTLLNQ